MTSSEETSRVQLFHSAYADANSCIQCGYCLPSCPTYVSMGKESASPRGRINLVRLAAQGKIGMEEVLAEPLDLCLGCRACETACPVGVPYARIWEAGKEAVVQGKGGWIERFALNGLVAYPGRLRVAGNLIWLYQFAGLDRLIRKTGFLKCFHDKIAQFERALPRLDSPVRRVPGGRIVASKIPRKMKVAFFTGCVMDALMYRTNRLSIELLTSIGCEVVIPDRQTCCGALHAHRGMTEAARDLAKKNIADFEHSGADWYVNNAGGCGAMLREYDHLLQGDHAWSERAAKFAGKMKDISELLVELGPLPFRKEWKGILTYQDSCHLRNVQGIFEEPRQLLKSIPGATFIEMDDSSSCCGSGGVYNLVHFDESMAILERKMQHVAYTQATVIATANPGCQLQMAMGIDRQGNSKNIRSMHFVDILAEACGLAP